MATKNYWNPDVDAGEHEQADFRQAHFDPYSEGPHSRTLPACLQRTSQ